MYQTHKTYIKPDMKMTDLINENPSLLLLMEYFELEINVDDKTVGQLCAENKISLPVFVVFGNLYNGFQPTGKELNSRDDIPVITNFLKNSHHYYKNDKYPEIKNHIKQLYVKNNREEVKLIEEYFNEYFKEVLEHLDYEDDIVFPYFSQLIGKAGKTKNEPFSVNEYREHHTDIETKLADLKNLLLKHLTLDKDRMLKRKLLISLYELEYDLNIHSIIEEKVLLPLADKLEKMEKNG